MDTSIHDRIWTGDTKIMGAKTFAIVEHHIEDVLIRALQDIGEEPSKTAVAAERDQLRATLCGLIDDAYVDACRARARAFWAKDMNFKDFMLWAQSRDDAVYEVLVARTNYYLGLSPDHALAFRKACSGRMMLTVDAFFVLEEERKAEERAKLEERLSCNLGTVIRAARTGDFTARVPERVGDKLLDGIAHDLDGLLSIVDDGVRAVQQASSGLSQGDLSARMTGRYQGALGELQTNFNSSVETLTDMVEAVQAVADQLQAVAGQVDAHASELSDSSESQVGHLSETMDAVEKLRTTMSENAAGAKQAAQTLLSAVAKVENVETALTATTAQIDRITEGSLAVQNLVSVIEDISAQTKMLALNASVEAARAGDAGRGFAVVAGEVRGLADQVAHSAETIRDLTTQNVKVVEDGAAQANDAHAALDSLRKTIGQVEETFGAITSAVQGQSETFAGIDHSADQLKDSTSANAKRADVGGATARDLKTHADDLLRLLAQFKRSDRPDRPDAAGSRVA